MPNKQGGYGGYRGKQQGDASRRVRAPGSGARQAPPYSHAPYKPGEGGHNAAPASYNTGSLDDGWVDPSTLTGHGAAPTPQAAAPRQQAAPPRQAAAPTRASARRAREQKRKRARLTLISVAAGIFVLAGIITLLLPKADAVPDAAAPEDTAAMAEQLVAPLPYDGVQQGDDTAAQALDWGTVGPVRQTESYTYTAAPEKSIALPEMGRVENSWFADAAFLGDSLTVGFSDYDIDVSGALICAYEGTSPNQIVNRTTLNNSERGEEIPLDVLSAAQPAKLYVLLGTNALVGTGNDDGFLNYYGRMLDELKAALPNTMIFAQSVLPVRPEALESAPGLASDRLATINTAIAAMCEEKSCYYLDLAAAFADESGALKEDIAQPDGIHITVAGYAQWVSYLATHVPYNINNPYQPGSTYYLDDSMKQLLADIAQ